jgi:hypothetical protein
MSRLLLPSVLGALVLVTAAPASAQWGRPDARPSYASTPYAEARRAAYDNGFREGLKEGQKDGRQRDRFEYRDERDFQRADAGYHHNFGDVERYRQSFRAGFADGYSQAYGRSVRPESASAYGRDYRSPAFDNGASDGFEKGREDARDNDPFDPRRQKWYREGDRHYDNDYGPRKVYEDEYRRGFLVGYEQGYRDGRYR